MTTAKRSFIFKAVFCAVLFYSMPASFGGNAVTVSGVNAEQKTPDRYQMTAVVTNSSGETREVLLRAQLSFYLLASPEGDKPAAILRKDFSEILRSGEARPLKIAIMNEGSAIPGAVRMEQSLRIRRQREWTYLK